MDDWAVSSRLIHRVDERLVALLVLLPHIVVAGRGGQEDPLRNWEIPVLQSEAKLRAFASGGLVGFVEDGEIEGVHPSACFADNMRRLIGREDNLNTIAGRRKEVTHLAASVVTGKSRSL